MQIPSLRTAWRGALLISLACSPALAQNGPGMAVQWRSTGGGFTALPFAPWSGYSFPNGVWVHGDFNGDGRADALHVVQGADYVHTWMSNVAGSFDVGSFRPWAGYGMPNGRWMVGDLNGDGRADLVHLVQGTDYAHTWLSNGNGSFRVGTFRPWAGYGIPNGEWLMGDINADGRADLVHVVNGADYVHTWTSNGAGGFAVGTFRPWAGYGMPNGRWMIGDLNADGRADLVHAVNGADYVHSWMSNGNGTFAVSSFRPWAGYGIPNGEWMLGDIDGDRRADIVHAVAGSNYVHTWRSLGNGSYNVGSFAAWAGYGIPNGRWLMADVNGDRRADLVHLVHNADYLHVWQSNGNGSFAIGTARPWGGYPMGATASGTWLAADFNADGRADLLHVFAISPQRNLRVSRHNVATLTEADAERILTDMTVVALRNDNPTDRTCLVRYVRNGGVGNFAAPNAAGNVNTQADFNAVIGIGAEVKVVNQINWCATVGTGIIGCAPVPGGSMAVVRFTAAREGTLWLHEHAHNRGRNHRNDVSAVMNPFITATALGLDQAECNALR